MGVSVLHPLHLLLLLGVPAAVWLGLKGRTGLSRRRRWLSSGVRAAILALLVLAAAELQGERTSDDLCVLFAVDLSKSVPPEFRARLPAFLTKTCEAMGSRDTAGVVVFGRDAMIEEPPTRPLKIASFASGIRRDQTDIAAGLRLALAAFPEGARRRIVLMTDGNENRGSAAAESLAARAAGVQVDVVPFVYEHPQEALVESFSVPAEAKIGEPFEGRVVVQASHAGPARLRVYRNRQLEGELAVALRPGKNVFPLTLKVPPSGQGFDPRFNAYEVTLEAERDTLPENNRAHGFTVTQGRHAVLLLGGEGRDVEALADALAREQILHAAGTPADVPLGAADLQNYDCLVLANVPATAFSGDQMAAIREAVRGTGMGLIMIGGESAFGAGGYGGTPVEEALPVDMDLRHKKVVPNGALCLIMHTCEIPQGNYWSEQIGVAAIKSLGLQDYAGVLIYGMQGEQWLFKMQPATDKPGMIAAIRNMQNGDMPTFDQTLRLAHQGLRAVPATLKHIVILSDGDPSPPPPALLDGIAADRITISTVAIGWHGGSDLGMMRRVATIGKGRCYEVTDPAALPQIFLKEAVTVRRASIIEERFRPRPAAWSELLKGLDPAALPDLYGYVPVSRKDLAEVPLLAKEEQDPLLAHWQFGLGRAVAFTSDAKPRWAKDWVAWERFGRFWAQAVRWCSRTTPRGNVHVSTAAGPDGRGRVTVEAVDADGRFLNNLVLEGTVTAPDATGHPLRFLQTAPGRYEASFPADQVGPYLVGVGARGAGVDLGTRTTGLAVSYAPEYRDLRTHDALLRQLAEATGGRILDAGGPAAEFFRHDRPPASTRTPLWPLLVLLAACLFPLDVAVRKLDVGRRELAAVRDAVLRRLPLVSRLLAPKKAVADPTLAALQAKIRSLRAGSAGAAALPGTRDSRPGTPDSGPGTPTASRRFEPSPDAPADAAGPVTGTESATRPPAVPGAPAPAGPPAAAPQSPPAEGGSYMKRLLDAKKRAQEKKPGE
jgi:uncharacterized membrane protein